MWNTDGGEEEGSGTTMAVWPSLSILPLPASSPSHEQGFILLNTLHTTQSSCVL
jgi:hypothetical protein